jgi:ACT domain-containing protein
MFKFILRWFRKDHAKAAANIISAFNAAKNDLATLNQEIAKTRHANTTVITQKQIHNAELDQIVAKNEKIAANLSILLGEEDPK